MNGSTTHPLRRTLAASLAAGAAGLLLTACVQTPGSTAATGASGDTAEPAAATKTLDPADITLYVVPGLTTHPAYRTMFCGAEAEAESLGVKVEYQGATTWDPSLQLPIVQSLLAKDPSALLLTPTDGSALKPVVDQYVAKGIPVLALDTTLDDPSELTAEITSSNEQGGAAAAKALGDAVGGKGSIAVISGSPSASTDRARVKGFTDEMAKSYPGITLLEPQYSKSVVATAASQVDALMLADPDLSGVFGVNGNSATGAANSIDNAGKKGKIFVAGYDAEPATVKLLQDGSISSLVVQDFATEGKLAVDYAVAALTGKSDEVVRKTQLDNVIATTANASDPEVSKYFYKEQCS